MFLLIFIIYITLLIKTYIAIFSVYITNHPSIISTIYIETISTFNTILHNIL